MSKRRPISMPRRACSMRWSAPMPRRRRAKASARNCAPASSTTRKSKSRSPIRGGAAEFRHSRHAGRSASVINHLRHARQGLRRQRTKTRRMTVKASHELLIAEESDKLLDQEQIVQEAIDVGREQRHRLPRRDRQDLRPVGAPGRRCQPRGRAARPAAAHRRHDGLDQIRAGEDRPHPVHRLGRLPYRQAFRPAAGIARPAADPRRAQGADARRFRAASSPSPKPA